jgi:hypothetical protein
MTGSAVNHRESRVRSRIGRILNSMFSIRRFLNSKGRSDALTNTQDGLACPEFTLGCLNSDGRYTQLSQWHTPRRSHQSRILLSTFSEATPSLSLNHITSSHPTISTNHGRSSVSVSQQSQIRSLTQDSTNCMSCDSNQFSNGSLGNGDNPAIGQQRSNPSEKFRTTTRVICPGSMA